MLQQVNRSEVIPLSVTSIALESLNSLYLKDSWIRMFTDVFRHKGQTGGVIYGELFSLNSNATVFEAESLLPHQLIMAQST